MFDKKCKNGIVLQKAINIEYDSDGENYSLPKEIIIPNDIDEEDIADYISDLTGFCILGFEIITLKNRRETKK